MGASSPRDEQTKSTVHWVLLVLFYLVLPLVHFSRLWWSPATGETLLALGDLYHVHWPNLALAWSAVRSGELPLWNPYMGGGFPLLADPQVGIYYPLHWLYVWWGGISEEPYRVFQFVSSSLGLTLSGLWMHLYLRGIGLKHRSALLGGTIVMTAGFASYYFAHRLLQPLLWAPLVFLLLERLWERPHWRRAVALGFVVGTAGLSGSLSGLVYLLVLAGIYLAVVGGPRWWREEGGAWRRQALSLLLAAAVALALLAVVLLPMLQYASQLLTSHSPLRSRVASSQMMGLLLPVLGESYYHGIVTLVLALLAFVWFPRQRRLFVFLAFVLLGLLLSFQDRYLSLDLTWRWPGSGSFHWRRMLCFLSLGLAALAAFGLEGFLSKERTSPLYQKVLRLLLRGWLFLGGGAFFLFLLFSAFRVKYWRYGNELTMLVLLLGLALLLFHRLQEKPQWAWMAGLVLLVIFDLFPLSRGRYQMSESLFRRWQPHLLQKLPRGAKSAWRVFNNYDQGPRHGANLLRVRDFMSPSLTRWRRHQRLLERVARRPTLLRYLNVRWYLAAQGRNPNEKHRLVRDLRRFSRRDWHTEKKRGVCSYRLKREVMPRVYWVPSWKVVSSGKAALGRLGHFDPWRTAILERSDLKARGAPLPRPSSLRRGVKGRVVAAGFNYLKLRIKAPAAGLVLVNEVYAPGWRAWRNGHPRPVLRANYLLRAVAVPAGEHTIVLRFGSWLYLLGFFLWLAAWTLAMVAFGSWYRERWKGLAPPSPEEKEPTNNKAEETPSPSQVSREKERTPEEEKVFLASESKETDKEKNGVSSGS